MSKVYVYESCEPLIKVTNKLTQVVQTERLRFTYTQGTIFKDNGGICWNFIGEFESDYMSNPEVFTVNYKGNYFEKTGNLSSNIFPTYDECLTTNLSSCTQTYFSATRCDSGNTVNVRVCNVGPTNGNVKLLPTIGQTCGVYNPSGDDFCVRLNSQISEVETEYEIITPGWLNYDCINCPSLKTYMANSCDGSITGVTIYDYLTSQTLSDNTVVSTFTNKGCYEIISYEGIKIIYGYNISNSYFISRTFNNCESCQINNLNA